MHWPLAHANLGNHSMLSARFGHFDHSDVKIQWWPIIVGNQMDGIEVISKH